MAELRVLPPRRKFLKKLKDKKLKSLYKEAIDAILEDPTIGEEKSGDLKGIRGYDIYHNRINCQLLMTKVTSLYLPGGADGKASHLWQRLCSAGSLRSGGTSWDD